MALIGFQVADGALTVIDGNGWVETHSTDYRARMLYQQEHYKIVIFPINYDTAEANTKRVWLIRDYTECTLGINGASYVATSGDDWVQAFNWACGTNIGFNTQYPQHIIADTIDLDTSVATQLTDYEKAGYMTISADEDNTGNVFVGDENVDSDSYQLEAGKSVFVELDDLSKWYAYGSVADCRVSICGAYKY